jgi:hypothetical protein
MNPLASWVFVITFPVMVNSGHTIAHGQPRNQMAAQLRKEFAAIRKTALNHLQWIMRSKAEALAELEEMETRTWLLNEMPPPRELLIRQENRIKERIMMFEEFEKNALELLRLVDNLEGIERR